ncbi:hypothetical protein J6590_080944 [Homalodisca vitripennis]|nr:hypothetical protein J6590_080944 [Homalodisca vitripennis]
MTAETYLDLVVDRAMLIPRFPKFVCGFSGQVHSRDSPWSLVQSAAETTANKQRDDIEFILWTELVKAVLSVAELAAANLLEAVSKVTELHPVAKIAITLCSGPAERMCCTVTE